MKQIVVLNPKDNVATSLAELAGGAEVQIEGLTLTVSGPVPFAHKLAIRSIAEGEDVVKYGEVIGLASCPIAPGDWVHVHNVESARARGDLA